MRTVAVSILRGADGRVRPFWRFLIAMVLWLLAQLAAYQLVRPESIVSVTAGIYFTLVTAITLGTVTWMSRVLDRATGPLAYIGFPMEVPAARLVGVGFLCGAGLVTLAALVMAIGGSTSFRLQLNAETMSAALTQFIVFAIAALHEEVVFRGYPFQRLVESVGAVAA